MRLINGDIAWWWRALPLPAPCTNAESYYFKRAATAETLIFILLFSCNNRFWFKWNSALMITCMLIDCYVVYFQDLSGACVFKMRRKRYVGNLFSIESAQRLLKSIIIWQVYHQKCLNFKSFMFRSIRLSKAKASTRKVRRDRRNN